MVDLNGAVKHLHANKLRKYHINVDEISCDTLTAGQINPRINHCAIIHEEDEDFLDIGTLNAPNPCQTELLPSQKIDRESLSHLSEDEKARLLAVLVKYPECFSETPGFVT